MNHRANSLATEDGSCCEFGAKIDPRGLELAIMQGNEDFLRSVSTLRMCASSARAELRLLEHPSMGVDLFEQSRGATMRCTNTDANMREQRKWQDQWGLNGRRSASGHASVQPRTLIMVRPID